MRRGAAKPQRRQHFQQLLLVDAADFADLPADGQHRVQAGRGILRGIEYFPAADPRPVSAVARRFSPKSDGAAADDKSRRAADRQHALASMVLPAPDSPSSAVTRPAMISRSMARRTACRRPWQLPSTQRSVGPQQGHQCAGPGARHPAIRAMASISTSAARGRSLTATAERAGYGSGTWAA